MERLDILVIDKLRKNINLSFEKELLKQEDPLNSPIYNELSIYSTNIPNFKNYFNKKHIKSITLFSDLNYFNYNFFFKSKKKKIYSIIDVVNNLKPKIIFLKDYAVISHKEINEISKLNFKKKIFTSIGIPLPNKMHYKNFDKIYFRNPNVIKRQGNYAREFKLIYHSFNEKLFEKIKLKEPQNRSHNLSFCGSIQSNSALHHFRRYNACYNLIKNKHNIRFYLNEENSFEHYLRFYILMLFKLLGNKIIILAFIIKLIGKIIKLIFKQKYKIFFKIASHIENLIGRQNPLYKGPLKKLFPTKTKKGLFGLSYYELINDSRISLNIHNDTDFKGFGYNIRNFEITGFKSCLLVEGGNNVSSLFEEDKECITYQNLDELEEKIKYLALNNKLVDEISSNGYKKTIEKHTHLIRSEEFYEDFKQYL